MKISPESVKVGAEYVAELKLSPHFPLFVTFICTRKGPSRGVASAGVVWGRYSGYSHALQRIAYDVVHGRDAMTSAKTNGVPSKWRTQVVSDVELILDMASAEEIETLRELPAPKRISEEDFSKLYDFFSRAIPKVVRRKLSFLVTVHDYSWEDLEEEVWARTVRAFRTYELAHGDNFIYIKNHTLAAMHNCVRNIAVHATKDKRAEVVPVSGWAHTCLDCGGPRIKSRVATRKPCGNFVERDGELVLCGEVNTHTVTVIENQEEREVKYQETYASVKHQTRRARKGLASDSDMTDPLETVAASQAPKVWDTAVGRRLIAKAMGKIRAAQLEDKWDALWDRSTPDVVYTKLVQEIRDIVLSESGVS